MMLAVDEKFVRRFAFALFWCLVALVAATACGGSGIGAACTTEGDTSECTRGALCAKNTSGALQCLQTCTQQGDCPSGTNCTGTAGTEKVCQPVPTQ
jgi:hypothetical protein